MLYAFVICGILWLIHNIETKNVSFTTIQANDDGISSIFESIKNACETNHPPFTLIDFNDEDNIINCVHTSKQYHFVDNITVAITPGVEPHVINVDAFSKSRVGRYVSNF